MTGPPIEEAEALHRIGLQIERGADPTLDEWLAWRQLALARSRMGGFAWRGGRAFEWAGERISAPGRGLLFGWMALAAYGRRLPAPPVAALVPGHRRPDAAALEAVRRADMHVPEPLAICLRQIGTAAGRLVVKGRLPFSVNCTSPELVRATTDPRQTIAG